MYREIMRSKELTPEAKAIYAYLCSFAGAGETCYPGTELMRAELQMGADRFYKHMRLLTDAGIIEKVQERKGNRWGNTIYKINQLPDFQVSQNESTTKSLPHSTDTHGQQSCTGCINNNSITNNSPISNRDITHICSLLNQGKKNASNSGKIHKETGRDILEQLINSGITKEEIINAAEGISKTKFTGNWVEFGEMLKSKPKGAV